MNEWSNFDTDIVLGVCLECDFETGDTDKICDHFDSTNHNFTWEIRNIQEVMCKKYNVILTDFQTKEEIEIEKKRLSRERKIKVVKRIGHIGGVIAIQSYQAIKAYNSKPVKKQKKKRKKQSTLYGLTGKRN